MIRLPLLSLVAIEDWQRNCRMRLTVAVGVARWKMKEVTKLTFPPSPSGAIDLVSHRYQPLAR